MKNTLQPDKVTFFFTLNGTSFRSYYPKGSDEMRYASRGKKVITWKPISKEVFNKSRKVWEDQE